MITYSWSSFAIFKRRCYKYTGSYQVQITRLGNGLIAVVDLKFFKNVFQVGLNRVRGHKELFSNVNIALGRSPEEEGVPFRKIKRLALGGPFHDYQFCHKLKKRPKELRCPIRCNTSQGTCHLRLRVQSFTQTPLPALFFVPFLFSVLMTLESPSNQVYIAQSVAPSPLGNFSSSLFLTRLISFPNSSRMVV